MGLYQKINKLHKVGKKALVSGLSLGFLAFGANASAQETHNDFLNNLDTQKTVQTLEKARPSLLEHIVQQKKEPPVKEESKRINGSYDLEFRAGKGIVCGLCVDLNREDRKNLGWKPENNFQVYADRLFPVADLLSGELELGPYVRIATIGKDLTPQAALGGALGYHKGSFEILFQIGIAYSSERIGDVKSGDITVKEGQSKTTFDLGVALRHFLRNDLYLVVGVGHNSNGKQLGIGIDPHGNNPGYDTLYIGVGKRF